MNCESFVDLRYSNAARDAYRQAYKEGFEKGVAEVNEEIRLLSLRLIEQEREDELLVALKDEATFQAYLEEFGIPHGGFAAPSSSSSTSPNGGEAI